MYICDQVQVVLQKIFYFRVKCRLYKGNFDAFNRRYQLKTLWVLFYFLCKSMNQKSYYIFTCRFDKLARTRHAFLRIFQYNLCTRHICSVQRFFSTTLRMLLGNLYTGWCSVYYVLHFYSIGTKGKCLLFGLIPFRSDTIERTSVVNINQQSILQRRFITRCL